MKATCNGAGAATAEQRHAIAVAVAKAAAAVQVARLTRPSTYAREHHYAAIVIQTAFRGYLVRRFSPSKIWCRKFVFSIIRISSIFFALMRRKELFLCGDCEGKESASCTKRTGEVASFSKGSQCEKASQDDIALHASSG